MEPVNFEPVPFAYHRYDPTIPMPAMACRCPRCVNLNYIERIEACMQNMSPEAYKQIYERMLVPLLRSFSGFNAHMFPYAWVESAPPVVSPSNPIRCLFHCMCVCLHAHKEVEGDEVGDVVHSIHGWGEELVSWLMRRRRSGGEAGQIERLRLARIVASLHELVGIDVIYRRMYIQISKIMRRECVSVTPAVMCAYGFDMGRQNHMVSVAQMFYEWYSVRRSPKSMLSLKILDYMHFIMLSIECRLQREIECKTALAMALHPRLGAQAGLSALGVDILPACVPKAVASIVTWRDVMGKWIGEDTVGDSF